MAGVSLIPENINKYAIEWARKISKEPIEHGKGLDMDIITSKIAFESDLYQGTRNRVHYDFRNNPKDIFIHNHPGGNPLSIDDIGTAAKRKVKKIFASTEDGYTAMDFTPLKPTISRNDMGIWTMYANQEAKDFFDKFQERVFIENLSHSEGKKIAENYLITKLREFADYTGALFEKVKWTDLK